MKLVLTALLAALALASCATPTVTEAHTVTETTPAPVAASYSPSFPAYTPTPTATQTQAAVVATNVEAKACGLVRHALTLPAFSMRWDDYVIDAEYAAKGDGAYKLIYKAENRVFEGGYDYEQEATADLHLFVKKFC